jgi:hypothetical protein
VSSDVLCLSHLRWDFVYQRPNHLMACAARDRRVFFVEEPILVPGREATMHVRRRELVVVATPRIPERLTNETQIHATHDLVADLVRDAGLHLPILWYYTPMAVAWTRQLAASLVVYDSMDHLAGFVGAPVGLADLESELIDASDLIFTGGKSLYARLAARHPAVRCFPSSVDVKHFGKARDVVQVEPVDQATIPHPRIGYAGVVDERLDLTLIADVAARRPTWQIVLLGPVVKIDPATIPTSSNIHLLGMKRYDELPAYLSGWNVGWMPFALNDATRFISPTKTPEYLAAGLPVVSTPIADVVDPYGQRGLVHIAGDATSSITAIESAMDSDLDTHRRRADAFLADQSWDRTWREMAAAINAAQLRRGTADPSAACALWHGPTPRSESRLARSPSLIDSPRGRVRTERDRGL